MIKTGHYLTFATLIGCVSPSLLFAQNVDVKFTASIRETTCDMRITGGSGDATNYIIPIGSGGKTSLDKIISADASASKPFTLDIVTCPSSITRLKTTVSGTSSSYLNTALTNNLSGAGAATYLGATISRSGGGDPFVINSTSDATRLVWTSAEINSKSVGLVAKIVPTYGNDKATPGAFSATATFNFTYE
ncbi:fimbrial protein [Pseudescherichia vulneris]|jgi:type 1 fimbria pilin